MTDEFLRFIGRFQVLDYFRVAAEEKFGDGFPIAMCEQFGAELIYRAREKRR